MGTYSEFVAFENMGYRLSGTEHSDYARPGFICDCDVMDPCSGEVIVALGDTITPDMADAIAALAEVGLYLGYGDECPAGGECPECGQRCIDLLEWCDDEMVECTVCGAVYDPLGECAVEIADPDELERARREADWDASNYH